MADDRPNNVDILSKNRENRDTKSPAAKVMPRKFGTFSSVMVSLLVFASL